MPADSEREPLPFEPTRKRKKSANSSATPTPKEDPKPAPVRSSAANRNQRKPVDAESDRIPEAVSRRMLRRMIFFSGIPVTLGILVFFASYVVITQHIAELPNVVVLLITLACFGLSVVGLSYGALSASWDEGATGSLVGYDQFKLNFGRLVGSWRQAREERRNNSQT